ncbi:hypothetical protein PG991_003508 [Apiospora marii]|uniref:Rhodopsin domain-containing protein n=1 Tax=Apiospora marii TaxID=335849 RepID=A0ABR1S3P0_9PEZI
MDIHDNTTNSGSGDPLAGLLPPPTGINNIHKVYSVTAVCIILCVIACVTVLTRLGVRGRKHDIDLDDIAMIPATLLYIGWTVLAVYVNLNAGVGKPLWEITLDEFSLWFKGIVVSSWLYPIMSASIRISTLLFYRRIFAKTNHLFRRVIWALLALQGIYVAVYSVLPAFVCDPIWYGWRPLERQLHCSDRYYAMTHISLYAVSMVFDVVLLVLPMATVWKLQMPVTKRLGTVVLFSLGAAIASAYKLGVFVDQQKVYVPTDEACKLASANHRHVDFEVTDSHII